VNKYWLLKKLRFFLFLTICGVASSSFIFAETALQKSESEKINPAEIQKALTQAGFYKGTIDGVIGKKTRVAIREFQTKNGLSADGVCGPKTWEKLKAHLEEATEMDTTSPDSLSPTVDEGLSTSNSVPEPEPNLETTSDELKQKLVS